MVIDTACSSSLTALNLACQSLILNETDFTFCGGVDLILDEQLYARLSEIKALSPDGLCRTFDHEANGFVPGEGAGSVLLKRIEDAVRDGDHIYGVIKGIAVNNDGKTMGITTPNPDAQAEVIKKAIGNSICTPNNIHFIETHGTGTAIGDPIELRALTQVFREFTQKKQFCGVGSVKSNMGHLLSASGIAGLIKSMISLKNRKLYPTLHCRNVNPRFDFESSPFYPVLEPTNYNHHSEPLTGAISSFGFGGTNVHVIVQEFIENSNPSYKRRRNRGRLAEFKKEEFPLPTRVKVYADSESQFEVKDIHLTDSSPGLLVLFEEGGKN